MTNRKQLKTDEFRAPDELVKQAEKHFRPVSKKELATARRYQESILKMLNTGARLTQEEVELAVSVRNEGFYRNMVEAGETTALHHLVNCLITQGRFEEALKLSTNRKEEIKELLEARDRDDYERCNCPSQTLENTNVPSEYLVRKQFNPLKQSFCFLYRCSVCGHMNLVEQLPEEIALYHAKRMNAIEGYSKR